MRRNNILKAAKKAGDIYTIHLMVFHAHLHAFGDHVGIFFCRPSVINGIAGRHTLKQKRFHLFLGLLGEDRDLHSIGLSVIRCNGIVAAAFR